MKESTLEPGVLQVLKFLAAAQVFGIAFVRNPIGVAMGLDMPLERWLVFALPVPLLLVGLTWIPWFHQKLGRAYVPFCLGIASVNLIGEKYLAISWFSPPAQQELQLLLLVVKSWLNMLLIIVVIAWQYSARSVLYISLAFSAADVVLSFPFMKPRTEYFSLTIVLFFARLITVTFVALVVQWLANRQRVQSRALAEANQKLIQYAATTEQLAASQERNRLARELHDTLAHSLSGVTVELEAVDALWDVNANAARPMLQHALQHTRSGLTEARRALQALRASPLEDLGLALAIAQLADSVAARANLKLELDVPQRLVNLRPEVEQSVYRIAQEVLTNVLRHAQATQVRVSLARANGHLTLTIADNGRGFEKAQVANTRYGLKGIRERAEMASGQLQVESEPRQGTIVRLTLPLAEE